MHLMRAGATGVLVGFGGGATHTTVDVLGVKVPMATAVADVAAARRDYIDESGGRYVHVIADGAMGRSGDMVKAIACGADAVMVAEWVPSRIPSSTAVTLSFFAIYPSESSAQCGRRQSR